MTQKVLVGSAALATVMEIEGSGFTPTEAQRNAVNVARSLHHIPDPVALVDNHRSAKIVRIIAGRKLAEVVARMRADLNRRSPMCFDNRYEPYQFD